MNRTFARFVFVVGACGLLPLAAHAQAFRTYLASYGADTNPCSVEQPCRLLPAALDKVLDGGEVWMLDSANYNAGTVEITKSVSILAVPGQIGSVAAVAGAPAIDISTAGVKVALRNIVIPNNANRPGTDGILMTNGARLSVEDSLFANIVGNGITLTGTTADVHVKNTVMRNVQHFAISAENGPSVDIDHSQFIGTFGLFASSSTASATIMNLTDSVISGGAGEGIFVTASVAGAVVMGTVTRSTITRTSVGLDCETGGVGTATLYVTSSTVTANEYGFNQLGTCALRTLGNNFIGGNSLADIGSLTAQALR